MKTDLTINATSATDGKKVTNKISYVNPDITNNQAIMLAQAICSLTTDSYNKTTRTDTSDCDVNTKIPRTLTYCKIAGRETTLDNGVYKVNVPISSLTASTFAVSIKETTLSNTLTGYSHMTELEAPVNYSLISNRLEFSSSTNSYYIKNVDEYNDGDVIGGTIVIPEDRTYRELTIPFEATLIQGE